MSKFYIQTEQDNSLTILFSDMEGDNDGNGWKFGLSFICCGIVFVMGMGVFSLVYHAQYKGKLGYLFLPTNVFCLLNFIIPIAQFSPTVNVIN